MWTFRSAIRPRCIPRGHQAHTHGAVRQSASARLGNRVESVPVRHETCAVFIELSPRELSWAEVDPARHPFDSEAAAGVVRSLGPARQVPRRPDVPAHTRIPAPNHAPRFLAPPPRRVRAG